VALPVSRRLVPGVLSPVASWGIDRVDQADLPLSGSFTWALDGTGVDVYVVDSGIRASHSELFGRVSAGFNAVAGEDPSATDDCAGHGTHLAGTIGGRLVGVAKAVNLIPVREYGCDAAGPLGDVLTGLGWTRDMVRNSGRPSVINLSFATEAIAQLNAAVGELIAAGAIVVSAAGNTAEDACDSSPAGARNSITVGSSSRTDGFSVYSNRGRCVSIIAPGESIISASYTADGDYAVMSGTSMATPHVVGDVAQLLQAQPRLNQVQVLRLLTASGIADSLSGMPAATTNLLLHSSPSGCGLFASDGGCAGAVIPQAPPPQDGATNRDLEMIAGALSPIRVTWSHVSAVAESAALASSAVAASYLLRPDSSLRFSNAWLA